MILAFPFVVCHMSSSGSHLPESWHGELRPASIKYIKDAQIFRIANKHGSPTHARAYLNAFYTKAFKHLLCWLLMYVH